MAERRPRLAWIGCGRHARGLLLPALAGLSAELAALCSRGQDNLRDTAARYGVKRLYADYRELLAAGGFDAVGITVGPEAHAEMAAAALDRGYPVFVEKPPGASLADARAVLAASRRAGKPAGLGFHKRFSVGNKLVRNVLGDGRFGPVLGVLAQYLTSPSYFGQDPDHRLFFLHHCVHYCDLLRHLAGPVASVEARGIETGSGGLLLHAGLRFASGAPGTLVMGSVQSRGNPVEFLQIMGDMRRIEVDNVQRVRYYRDPGFKAEDPSAGLDEREDALVWEPNYTLAAPEDVKGYRAMLADFLGLLEGKPALIAQAEDGVEAMRLLEALEAAWSEKRTIYLSKE